MSQTSASLPSDPVEQVKLLKTALIRSQKRVKELESEISAAKLATDRDVAGRAQLEASLAAAVSESSELKADNKTLSLQVKQMSARLVSLQEELKIGAGGRSVAPASRWFAGWRGSGGGPSDAGDGTPDLCVLQEELFAKIEENRQLHCTVEDLKSELAQSQRQSQEACANAATATEQLRQGTTEMREDAAMQIAAAAKDRLELLERLDAVESVTARCRADAEAAEAARNSALSITARLQQRLKTYSVTSPAATVPTLHSARLNGVGCGSRADLVRSARLLGPQSAADRGGCSLSSALGDVAAMLDDMGSLCGLGTQRARCLIAALSPADAAKGLAPYETAAVVVSTCSQRATELAGHLRNLIARGVSRHPLTHGSTTSSPTHPGSGSSPTGGTASLAGMATAPLHAVVASFLDSFLSHDSSRCAGVGSGGACCDASGGGVLTVIMGLFVASSAQGSGAAKVALPHTRSSANDVMKLAHTIEQSILAFLYELFCWASGSSPLVVGSSVHRLEHLRYFPAAVLCHIEKNRDSFVNLDTAVAQPSASSCVETICSEFKLLQSAVRAHRAAESSAPTHVRANTQRFCAAFDVLVASIAGISLLPLISLVLSPRRALSGADSTWYQAPAVISAISAAEGASYLSTGAVHYANDAIVADEAFSSAAYLTAHAQSYLQRTMESVEARGQSCDASDNEAAQDEISLRTVEGASVQFQVAPTSTDESSRMANKLSRLVDPFQDATVLVQSRSGIRVGASECEVTEVERLTQMVHEVDVQAAQYRMEWVRSLQALEDVRSYATEKSALAARLQDDMQSVREELAITKQRYEEQLQQLSDRLTQGTALAAAVMDRHGRSLGPLEGSVSWLEEYDP